MCLKRGVDALKLQRCGRLLPLKTLTSRLVRVGGASKHVIDVECAALPIAQVSRVACIVRGGATVIETVSVSAASSDQR